MTRRWPFPNFGAPKTTKAVTKIEPFVISIFWNVRSKTFQVFVLYKGKGGVKKKRVCLHRKRKKCKIIRGWGNQNSSHTCWKCWFLIGQGKIIQNRNKRFRCRKIKTKMVKITWNVKLVYYAFIIKDLIDWQHIVSIVWPFLFF